MQIEIVTVGDLQCNCYILTKDNQTLVIDPGDEYDKIKAKLKDKNVLGVLITHHHFDHVGALEELVSDYQVKVYDRNNLTEGETKIGPFSLEAIYTPGHTSDSVTYYFKDDKVMFGGDFIFKYNIGRCDLPTGDFKEMLKSITKIKKYPIDTKIYPGHGEDTTLEEEILHNEYFS